MLAHKEGIAGEARGCAGLSVSPPRPRLPPPPPGPRPTHFPTSCLFPPLPPLPVLACLLSRPPTLLTGRGRFHLEIKPARPPQTSLLTPRFSPPSASKPRDRTHRCHGTLHLKPINPNPQSRYHYSAGPGGTARRSPRPPKAGVSSQAWWGLSRGWRGWAATGHRLPRHTQCPRRRARPRSRCATDLLVLVRLVAHREVAWRCACLV